MHFSQNVAALPVIRPHRALRVPLECSNPLLVKAFVARVCRIQTQQAVQVQQAPLVNATVDTRVSMEARVQFVLRENIRFLDPLHVRTARLDDMDPEQG